MPADMESASTLHELEQSNNPVVKNLHDADWTYPIKKGMDLDAAYTKLYVSFLEKEIGCRYKRRFFEANELDSFRTLRRGTINHQKIIDDFLQNAAKTKLDPDIGSHEKLISEEKIHELLMAWNNETIHFPYEALVSALQLPDEYAAYHLEAKKICYFLFENNKWMIDLKLTKFFLTKMSQPIDRDDDQHDGMHFEGDVNLRYELTDKGFCLTECDISSEILKQLMQNEKFELTNIMIEDAHQEYLLNQAICELNLAVLQLKKTMPLPIDTKEDPYECVVNAVLDAKKDVLEGLLDYEQLREVIVATKALVQGGKDDKQKLLAYKKHAEALYRDPLKVELAKAMLSLVGILLNALSIGAIAVTGAAAAVVVSGSIGILTGCGLIGTHGYLFYQSRKERPLTKAMLSLSSLFQPPDKSLKENLEELRNKRQEIKNITPKIGGGAKNTTQGKKEAVRQQARELGERLMVTAQGLINR